MIELIKSIAQGILSVIKFVVSGVLYSINVFKVLGKLFFMADEFLYLLPSFLLVFALLFMVLFVFNRMFRGRN